MRLIEKIIGPSGKVHSATVIFFHGSGDTGHGIIEWIRFLLGRDLDIPHIKFIYPTAPVQKYTPLNQEYSNVWFDRKSIDIRAPEDPVSLKSIYEQVEELIERELQQLSSPKRLVVGGFSMGGTLALHTGYKLNQNIGGVFALSSFLNQNSIVYEALKKTHLLELPKLLQYHGERDTLVPVDWGRETHEELRKLNIEGDFFPLRNTLHELKKHELLELEKWLEKVLPQKTN